MDLGRLSYRCKTGSLRILLSRNPNPPHNTHAGILYDDGGHWRLLHFAMHRRLLNDPLYSAWQNLASEDVGFVDPDLHDGLKTFLSQYCWYIGESERNRTIPYTFEDDPELVFDISGHWSGLNDGRGLTCATFVLKVFQSVGMEVVDRSNWPITDDDRAAQRRLANYLRREGYGEQAAIIESEIVRKIHRISPEQVAGAFLEDVSTWPTKHHCCIPNSKSVCCMVAWPFGPTA
jgi:hypothetical protein